LNPRSTPIITSKLDQLKLTKLGDFCHTLKQQAIIKTYYLFFRVNHRWQNRPLRHSHYGHDDQLSATAEESDGAATARSSPQEDACVAGCPGHHQVHQRPSTRGLPSRWVQLPKSQPLQREEQL